MSTKPNDLPPIELSLKYVAWNVKEIAECVKLITQAIESLAYRDPRPQKTQDKESDALPF